MTGLAWSAGFMDGEGNVGVNYGNRTPRLVLGMGQTDPYVLERFLESVGGVGSVTGPYIPANPNAQPMWNYRAYNEDARHVIEMLEPYLSPQKRKQAAIAIARVKKEGGRV